MDMYQSTETQLSRATQSARYIQGYEGLFYS